MVTMTIVITLTKALISNKDKKSVFKLTWEFVPVLVML